MRSSRILCSLLLGLLLTTACFGQLGNVNLKPIDGMPFVNRTHRLGRGIVGMWLFNDRPLVLGTTRDLSGNGNHGRLVGDTRSVAGKFGNALEFDGAGDYVDCGNNASLDITGNFTAGVWVKINNLAVNQYIYGRGLGNSDGWYFRVGTNGQIILITNQAGANQQTKSSVGAITIGIWYHIAITRVGPVVKIYVNGIDDTAISGTHIDPLTTTRTARIGVNNGLSDWLNGQIDHVIIYNRALSAGEIKDLYRDPFQMFEQERIPIAIAAAPPTGGRSFGVIIASIPFGIFGICGIALAFGYSERKAA